MALIDEEAALSERAENAANTTPSSGAGTAAALLNSATPSQLRAPQLPRQLLRGYERGATDRLLERAAKAIEGLSQVVTQLRSEIAELTSARDELQRKFDGALDSTGVHKAVGEVLVMAHKAAEELRADAQREAEQLVAEREAAAGARADELIAAAQQAHEAARRAEQEAAALVAEGERRAAELVEEAKAERERMLEEAAAGAIDTRAELELELEQLHREIQTTRSTWLGLLQEALTRIGELPDRATLDEGSRAESTEWQEPVHDAADEGTESEEAVDDAAHADESTESEEAVDHGAPADETRESPIAGELHERIAAFTARDTAEDDRVPKLDGE
jgi:cell division septum initiation protein DivIVA